MVLQLGRRSLRTVHIRRLRWQRKQLQVRRELQGSLCSSRQRWRHGPQPELPWCNGPLNTNVTHGGHLSISLTVQQRFFLLLFKQIAYESCDMGNVFWPVSISVSQSRAGMESPISHSNCGEVNWDHTLCNLIGWLEIWFLFNVWLAMVEKGIKVASLAFMWRNVDITILMHVWNCFLVISIYVVNGQMWKTNMLYKTYASLKIFQNEGNIKKLARNAQY
jgi:hypothetical protein